MIVGFYARVSTEEQRERSTITAQVEYAKARAAAEGWELRLFLDDGVTGTKPLGDRPGGKRLIAAARAGELHQVATYRVDRLGRTLRVVLGAMDAVGVPYRSLTEPFETATPMGRAMLGLLGVFAELERDTIVERTKAGIERVGRERARYLGGVVPYGYRLRADRTIEIDDAAADVVRLIFRLSGVERLSIEAIARELTRRGISAPKGERWHTSAIGRILTRRVYVGEWVYGRDREPDRQVVREVEPIVSRADFERARAAADERTRWQRAHPTRAYMFRGLLRCASCDRMLTAYAYRQDRTTTRRRNAYRCPEEVRTAKREVTSIRESDLLAVTWPEVERFFADPGELVRMLVARQEAPRPSEERAERELVDLAVQLREHEEREARLLDAHLTTAFRPEVLAAKAAEVAQRRRAIESRMAEVRRDRVDAARALDGQRALAAHLATIAERVRTADAATKAAVLRLLIRRVEVRRRWKRQLRVRVVWAFGQQDPRSVSSEVPDASEWGMSLDIVRTYEIPRAMVLA